MQVLNSTELKEQALQFFTLFRQRFLSYLKDGVAIMVKFYPYPNGLVAVAYLNNNDKWQNVFKETSGSMLEALNKTNLFDFRGIKPVFKTPSLAVTPNKIVFVKSDNSNEWDDKAMEIDISDIITKIKEILSTEQKVLAS